MKKILFIFDRNLSSLPPMMAIIDSLIENCDITYIVRDHEDEIENLYKFKNIKFIAYSKKFKSNAKLYRGINRLIKYSFFKYSISKMIKSKNYDLVWIATAEAAVLLGKPIKDVKYLFSIYELYDIVPKLLNKIKPIAQQASCVIVPEINRAFMLRFWLKLDETPTVLPNKPVTIPEPSKEMPYQLKSIGDKKIILYQGHITKARNLDAMCKAVSDMPDFALVLMGSSYDNYLSELLIKFPNIIKIDFLPSPSHLMITSKAYIGIVTYDYTDLNGIYCAPNKIWEYAAYGIPMLANDIPGLIYTVEQNKCGCCVDMSDVKKIQQAIQHIDGNYSSFKESSYMFFDSVNVKEIITSIVNNTINKF